jgi:predicted RNA-binding Zn ribbon-like protein
MGGTESGAAALSLIGGRLCLDFANTVGSHAGEHPNEYLRSYRDLVAWGRHAGILTGAEERRLLEAAAGRPDEAGVVLHRAIVLREAIYRIFSAVAVGRAPDAAALEILNAALARALPHARIVSTDDGFAWAWRHEEGALDRMLWPVARSAAELLTGGELDRVRECANDACGWLFLDLSRNRSRRWCDMRDCGNRVKARRYYQRRRAAGNVERGA